MANRPLTIYPLRSIARILTFGWWRLRRVRVTMSGACRVRSNAWFGRLFFPSCAWLRENRAVACDRQQTTAANKRFCFVAWIRFNRLGNRGLRRCLFACDGYLTSFGWHGVAFFSQSLLVFFPCRNSSWRCRASFCNDMMVDLGFATT